MYHGKSSEGQAISLQGQMIDKTPSYIPSHIVMIGMSLIPPLQKPTTMSHLKFPSKFLSFFRVALKLY